MFNYNSITNNHEPYVIAEIGANHNGDMDLARKMIASAKECGAHAAKFQSWTDKSLISQEEYNRNQSYAGSKKKHFGSLQDMAGKYYLRSDQHHELKKYCDEIGIDFCSTPFSMDEADLLEELDVPFYKIASCDLNNWPLLHHVARKNKPVILSTGMADIGEIDAAVKILENEGVDEIAILHCIAIYPPEAKDIHLNNITMLAQTFKYPIGFSDHSLGSTIPLAAVALGARIIEKHFTLDRDMEGWDHDISANPQEMKVICDGCKVIPLALGNHERIVAQAELEKRIRFRRSIVAKRELKAGHVITEKDIDYKRPATQIPPNQSEFVIGRSLKNNLKPDALIKWSDLT